MTDRVRLIQVSKKYSKLQGAKLLSHWGWWKPVEGSRWFWSLRDVSLDIRPGQTLGVIGANGSGKTTLLRIITGVTDPTHGTVIVNGKVVSLLEIFAGMHAELTGRENIYLNGIILGMRQQEIRRKFDAIVEFAGIENFLEMPLKHYSTGMMMRVGFSVAMHVEADIVLVDESWSIGDQSFQAKSLRRLAELQQRGAALVLVTHDLEIIRKHTQQTLWLDQGNVAALGPTAEVTRTYAQKT